MNNIKNQKKSSISILLVSLMVVLTTTFLYSHYSTQAAPTSIYEVNSEIDAPDSNPGDGTCETAQGNQICTLRAAIQTANSQTGHDLIVFSDGVDNIALASALPALDDPAGTTINDLKGSSVVISGEDGGFDCFSLYSENNIIQSLTITNCGTGLLITSSNNLIGVDDDGDGTDAMEGNLIINCSNSGNKRGINLLGAANNNVIAGNRIGTDGTSTADGNSTGIYISGNGNRVGTDADGNSDLLERNLISGNNFGINLNGTEDTDISGNFIGIDETGFFAIPNTVYGIYIYNSSRAVIGADGNGLGDNHEGNLISGNGTGIRINAFTGAQSEAHIIAGNLIGVSANGQSAIANHMGISVEKSRDNDIGLNLPYGFNVISGNTTTGISLSREATTGNLIQNNYIGTDASETLSLPNKGAGILVGSGVSGTTIMHNSIYHNGGDGISVLANAGLDNSFGNTYRDNGGLAIDLMNDGVTLNDAHDADTGPNNLQNFPVLKQASSTGSAISVQGSLDSYAETSFLMFLFASESCDLSGYGEGDLFLGEKIITTDLNGEVDFSFSANTPLQNGKYISAIVRAITTGISGTSEFSKCVEVETPAQENSDLYLPIVTR